MSMERDWKHLISQGETMHVDFKAAMPWSGVARADLAKDIVAMANVRDGGILLIGVSELPDGSTALAGLSEDELTTFDKTKVCDYVDSYFQPTVSLRIERPIVDGHALIAIHVTEFESTPVICIADGPEKKSDGKGKRAFYAGDLIVRTIGAKSEAIRTAEDMRALIRFAISKTSNTLLVDVRRIIEGGGRMLRPEPYTAEREMWSDAVSERNKQWRSRLRHRGIFSVVLLPAPPIEQKLDDDSMKRAIRNAHVYGRVGLDLPSIDDNVTKIQNKPKAIQGILDLDDYQEIWQLHSSGAFMYSRVLNQGYSQKTTPGPVPILEFELVIWMIGLAVVFAQRFYGELCPDGALSYEITIEGIKGHRLVSADPFKLRGNYETAEEKIVESGQLPVLDLRSAWRDLVFRVAEDMFRLFNWSPLSRSVVERELDVLEGRRNS